MAYKKVSEEQKAENRKKSNENLTSFNKVERYTIFGGSFKSVNTVHNQTSIKSEADFTQPHHLILTTLFYTS